MNDRASAEKVGFHQSRHAMSDPRYPIGRFAAPTVVPPTLRRELIDEIEALPGHLRAAVEGLSEEQLEQPYREGGWTIRQLVHHVADSHINAYARFRLAATEEHPTIKPYDERRWADLPDAREADVALSLALLDALHARWTLLLRGLPDEAFARVFVHPENGAVPLDRALAHYAWHGAHHVAHVTKWRERHAGA